jgi:hypothetical protein
MMPNKSCLTEVGPNKWTDLEAFINSIELDGYGVKLMALKSILTTMLPCRNEAKPNPIPGVTIH